MYSLKFQAIYLSFFLLLNASFASASVTLDNYLLVGTIQVHRDGATEGLAVIRDKTTQENLTLFVGDSLPNNPNMRLTKITKKHLIFSGNDQFIYLKDFIQAPKSIDREASQKLELESAEAEKMLSEFKESNRKILEASIKTVQSFDEEQIEALNPETH